MKPEMLLTAFQPASVVITIDHDATQSVIWNAFAEAVVKHEIT